MRTFDEPVIANIHELPMNHILNDFGKPVDFQKLIEDPDSGLYIEHTIYKTGAVTKYHTHSCAHGIYVLGGTLLANDKEYGPGTMLWFPQGTKMEHGATEKEDADVLFIWSGMSIKHKFDINYLEK